MVIAVIAILASLVLPALGKANRRAERVKCLSNLRQQAVGLILYANENEDSLPMRSQFSYALSPDDKIPQDRQQALEFLEGLGKLYPQYIEEPKVFYCPSLRHENLLYDGLYGWVWNFPLHITGGNNGINNGYTYLYNSWYDGIVKLQQLGEAALSADVYFASIGDICHLTGYNVSYTDGHAEWYPDANREVARSNAALGSNNDINRDWWTHFSKSIAPKDPLPPRP